MNCNILITDINFNWLKELCKNYRCIKPRQLFLYPRPLNIKIRCKNYPLRSSAKMGKLFSIYLFLKLQM
jgi:hypothetical protein